MNIVKVTVETRAGRKWVGQFNGLPTLEKLAQLIQLSRRDDRKHLLDVLKVATPILVSSCSSWNKVLTHWFATAEVAGMRIGTVKFEKAVIHLLEDDEQVNGFTTMNS